MRLLTRTVLLTLVVLICGVDSAFAQNWTFDARSIALGGSSGDNVATELLADQQPYRAIVLPFGLIQLFRDFSKLNPSNDEFDLVRTMEYAASPLHFIVGRGTTDTGGAFVNDIRNGHLNRNLTAYRGFTPANNITAEGLSAPSFGKTFIVHRDGSGFQGIKVGAGPYLATRTTSNIDPRLTDILGSQTAGVPANSQFVLGNSIRGQAALAIVGGYVGRFNIVHGEDKSGRNGFYVALDYNYLRGFRLEDVDMNLRVDTDAAGLVTFLPSTTPITISRVASKKGSGMAIDLGLATVVDKWEVGFGANGLGNHITWSDAKRTTYTLQSLVSEAEFTTSPAIPVGDERVELPVDYRGNVRFNMERWSALGEIGHGFQGTSFHGGFELRTGKVDLRGGGRLANEQWNPTGGVGFNLSERVSLDVAAFGTSANVERKRQLAIATSIRINQKKNNP
jgi:hypothetical protein